MKRKALGLLLAMALLPVSSHAGETHAATGEIQVQYNGKAIAFPDQKPIIRENRTLVPIRAIAEGLGFQVNWNNAARTVTISKGTHSVRLTLDQKIAYRDNQPITLDVPAQLINDRTIVPVRFIAEGLNYQVNWVAANRTVKIDDRTVYARLHDVVVYSDEVDKQWKALLFLFLGNQTDNPIAQVLRAKAGDDTLYGRYLIAQNGDAIKVPQTQLDEFVKAVKAKALARNHNSEKAMQQEMAALGITDQDIRELGYLDIYTTMYVKTNITDTDLQAYYEKNKAQFTVATVRHILVDTETEAKSVIDRLKKGESFATLAKTLSKDPGSKDNGGLYADADVSKWVPEFRDAVMTQPIGQVGQPVKTSYGYHVILVEKRTVKPLSLVKDAVMSGVVQEKTKQLRAEAFKDKTN